MYFKSLNRIRNILFLLVISAAVLLVAYWYWQFQASQWVKVMFENPKMEFSHHQDLKRTAPQDGADTKRVEFLFRATESDPKNMLPLVVVLKKETGLRLPSSLSRMDVLDMLLKNSEKAFPLRYEEYQKEGEKKFEFQGKKAAELLFTYKGPGGERVRQRFFMVEYDGNIAFLLSAQARESDFSNLNRKYFEKMFSSMRF